MLHGHPETPSDQIELFRGVTTVRTAKAMIDVMSKALDHYPTKPEATDA